MYWLKKSSVTFLKLVVPLSLLAALFPQGALSVAEGGKDLLALGDATVGKTFGADSNAVKWIILAEVIVGGIMYMMTKNVKFLAGFIILSVFILVGMKVAGY